MSEFRHNGGGGGGEQLYLGKRIDKIEHEGIGTCARIEINQDADNADQRVKWFLKVHKIYKLLWEAYFQFSFSPRFYSGLHFAKFSSFTPLKMRVKLRT